MAEVRRKGLILLSDVRELIAQGTPFDVRYDLVGGGDYEHPRYQCTYVVTEDGETVDYTLVRQQPGPYGAKAREFLLWPGLVRHHREFGGGIDLRLSLTDWRIEAVPPGEGAAKDKREA